MKGPRGLLENYLTLIAPEDVVFWKILIEILIRSHAVTEFRIALIFWLISYLRKLCLSTVEQSASFQFSSAYFKMLISYNWNGIGGGASFLWFHEPTLAILMRATRNKFGYCKTRLGNTIEFATLTLHKIACLYRKLNFGIHLIILRHSCSSNNHSIGCSPRFRACDRGAKTLSFRNCDNLAYWNGDHV